MALTVVKAGGSLLDGEPRALLETLVSLAGAGHPLVVVPGGGAFADAVRSADARHGAGPSASHWMAVLAMDQMAHLLVGLTRHGTVALVRSPAGIARALARRRLAVLAPYRWLRAADPLPHDWAVTGDSIAAWVAGQLGAERLVLLKSVDGAVGADGRVRPSAPASELGDVADRYFPRALPSGLECRILNGRRPELLRELLELGDAQGTRVC